MWAASTASEAQVHGTVDVAAGPTTTGELEPKGQTTEPVGS